MRNTLIIKKILALACVPAGTISIIPALISQQNYSEEEGIIPDEWLNVNESGVLTGFAEGVTIDAIRSGNYTTLKLPSNVKEIADYAFAYVFDNKSTNVTKLILNPEIEKIGNGAFLYCYGFNNIIEWNKLTNLKYIGDDAFNYCPLLSGVLDLPTQLEYIGKTAFKGCQGFTQIKIPISVKFVGDYAFEDCTNVTDVFIRNNDSYNQFVPDWFGPVSYAFTDLGTDVQPVEEEPVAKTVWIDKFNVSPDEWTRLLQSQLNLPEDFEVHGDKEIADETTLKIENGICKGFADGVDWTKYKLIRIPDGVTEIGAKAFEEKISDLNDQHRIYIEFDNDLEKIGDHAFDGCRSLAGPINLPSKCTNIGIYAFNLCTRITGTFVFPLNMPNKTIPEKVLSNCDHLSKVVFQELPDEIGQGAFLYDVRLNEIDFSNITSYTKPNWTSGKDQFEWIEYLGTVYFPSTEKWKEVQENFTSKLKECGLQNIDDWVQTININHGKEFPYHPEQPIEGQSYYFSGNELVKMRDKLAPGWDLNVTDYQIVRIPDKTLKIRHDAFNGKLKLPEPTSTPSLFQTNWNVKFNQNIQEIGDRAFQDCDGIVGYIDLQHSLKKIGDSAFKNCKNLVKAKIYETTDTIGTRIFEGCEHLDIIDLVNIKTIPKNWSSDPFGLPDTGRYVLILINNKMPEAERTKWIAQLESWVPNAIIGWSWE